MSKIMGKNIQNNSHAILAPAMHAGRLWVLKVKQKLSKHVLSFNFFCLAWWSWSDHLHKRIKECRFRQSAAMEILYGVFRGGVEGVNPSMT